MADPFLEITDFEDQFGRNLSDAETLIATRLLQVVSDWIRDRAPADVSDSAAEQVVFEVTRDALLCGEFGPFTSFTKTMGPRTRSATIDPEALSKFITGRHRLMLGLAAKAAPRGHFPKCDY